MIQAQPSPASLLLLLLWSSISPQAASAFVLSSASVGICAFRLAKVPNLATPGPFFSAGFDLNDPAAGWTVQRDDGDHDRQNEDDFASRDTWWGATTG
ncbi:hypothetical protein DFJ73DRAFT_957630, partial [Zopfochytrium polystomum]